MWDTIATIVVSAGIPSAIVSLVIWHMQQKILERDKAKDEETIRYRKEREAKERDKEQMEIHLIESVNAAVSLSEATARAVQRIPDAHCNGDMTRALEYATEVKHKQKDFLMHKGVKAIIE